MKKHADTKAELRKLRALYRKKKLEEAAMYLEIANDDRRALNQRGREYFAKKQQYELAVKCCDRVCRFDHPLEVKP